MKGEQQGKAEGRIQHSTPGETLPRELEHETNLFAYLRILRSYWWILAPLAILGGAAGLAFCHLAPPLYRAECRFEIFQNVMLKIGDSPEARLHAGGRRRSPLALHILLLKSKNLNDEIATRLKRKWHMDASLGLKKVNLTVEPVKGAPDAMLDIQVDSFDAQYSLEYLKDLLVSYRRLRLAESTQIYEATSQNLRKEKDKLAADLAKARSEIIAFEAKHNLDFGKRKKESDFEHLADILQKHRELSTQYTIIEAQFPFLKEANAATLRDVLDLTIFSTGDSKNNANRHPTKGGGWSEIREWRDNEAAIIRLEAEYTHMRKTYKPGHPKMLAVKQKIDTAKRELKIYAELTRKRLLARREALRMQKGALMKAAQKIETNLDLDVADRAFYEGLKVEAEHLTTLHDKVFARIIDSSTVNKDKYFSRLVEGPNKLAAPVWPVKWKSVALGIFGATSLGAGLLLLLFFRRVRLYDFDSLELSLNVPCLAGIPRLSARQIEKGPLFLNEQSKSSLTCEAYRSLRTAIESRLVGPPSMVEGLAEGPERSRRGEGRTVLITSPGPKEGKTFTSLNLANVFAWSKEKVLIMDGDFRRTGLRDMFPEAPVRGLIDCLKTEDVTWADCIVSNVAPNLDYLPAGHAGELAPELLQGEKLHEIMQELKARYKVVIIDSAPANHVVDTVLLGSEADATVLVARSGKTPPASMRYAASRLAAANIIGFTLNSITPSSQKYSAYAGSSYYSHRSSNYPSYYYPGKEYY